MESLDIRQQITFLYTHDLKMTADFYENIMGMKLLIDQKNCRIYEVTRNGWLGFCERKDTPIRTTGIIFTIVTSNVDGWYLYLKSQDVLIKHKPIENEKFRIYHFFINDPNGYLIEIQKFLDLDRL